LGGVRGRDHGIQDEHGKGLLLRRIAGARRRWRRAAGRSGRGPLGAGAHDVADDLVGGLLRGRGREVHIDGHAARQQRERGGEGKQGLAHHGSPDYEKWHHSRGNLEVYIAWRKSPVQVRVPVHGFAYASAHHSITGALPSVTDFKRLTSVAQSTARSCPITVMCGKPLPSTIVDRKSVV